MKLSVAAALLVSTTTVVAFQPTSLARTAATIRPSVLRAIAIDSTTGNVPTPPPVNGTPEEKEPLDWSGIALSVSADRLMLLDSRWVYSKGPRQDIWKPADSTPALRRI
jgi:hypothetical protein